MWAFTFSALFFAVMRSWGDFPIESLTAHVTPFEGSTYNYPIWPFFTYMVIFGTVVPYILVINSIRHIGGAGASIMGITEPPIAAAVAWVVLGEALSIVQILGGFVILAGVYIAENAREHSADQQPIEVELETTS
jgi:drug/metabolite transporter (DMT)-like permease